MITLRHHRYIIYRLSIIGILNENPSLDLLLIFFFHQLVRDVAPEEENEFSFLPGFFFFTLNFI